MKPKYLSEGDLVVCNDELDATLFVVLEVDHKNVLVREAGTNTSPVWHDYSLFQPPSNEQMGG